MNGHSSNNIRGERKPSLQSNSGSRIPISTTPTLPRKNSPLHRSTQSLYGSRLDDDNDSVTSFGSVTSTATCDHSHFARNGTTYSGRSRRFVVHCSSPSTSPKEYLTPTQRANSTIRHLKGLLNDSKVQLEEKEKEIVGLTKKMIELKLGREEEPGSAKARGEGPTIPARDSHRPNFRFITTEISDNDGSHLNNRQNEGSPLGVSTSLSDSGHFEELSPHPSPRNSNVVLEREIDKLKHQHEEEVKVLKESTKEKMDTLINRLTEATDRFCELKPQLEAFQSRVAELEDEKEEILRKYKESEGKHKSAYLQMFNKGQEAAIFQKSEDIVLDGEPILTLPDLLKQLQVTRQELESVKTMYRRLLEAKKSKSEQNAEVTLQFLKSAVYYFLTDRENTNGHLAAIQSILGFSPEERGAIEKASSWK